MDILEIESREGYFFADYNHTVNIYFHIGLIYFRMATNSPISNHVESNNDQDVEVFNTSIVVINCPYNG